MSHRSPRTWIVAALVVLGLILLSWVAFPGSNSSSNGGTNGGLIGSTYGRSPNGYGAWYASLEQSDTPITRWQKPFDQLADRSNTVLVRIGNRASSEALNPEEQEWVEKGNRMVLVGIRGRVTAADFSSLVESDYGAIALDTRRRWVNLPSTSVEILGDRYGAIVWRQTYGKGDVISIAPLFIAANAYQNQPGNFDLLTSVVVQDGYERLIDEYIHGYRDLEDIVEEIAGSWSEYLAQTPFLPALVQVGLLLLLLLWVNNRRHRPPVALKEPEPNSSRAYIDALAGVLQKAESSNFVIEVVGREEQRQIQRALGLGTDPVNADKLFEAWQHQTGHPILALNRVMQAYWHPDRMNEAQLLQWVEAVYQVHRQLETVAKSDGKPTHDPD
ncbi:MAG: DUF4350 domain-containing protein [Elainellaceae cyanobacterium]